MKPLKGTVTDVLDGLQIRTEDGLSVHWPHRMGLKLGSKVLVFYDFTRRRVKDAFGVKDFSIIDKLTEPKEEPSETEDTNNHHIFEEDERRTNA